MSKKTRIKWNLDLELILIDIWQAKLNDLRKQKRNAHVYNEIAGMLKSPANYCEASSNINGNDIKNKICNLTQRYRNEKKVTGPSGGTRSTWVHFEQIHAILGSLPCNDFSLINESLNVSSEIQQINLDDGDLLVVESDDSGEDEINIETTAHENNYDSPSTSSASGSHPPSASTSRPPSTPASRPPSAPATFPVANTTKKI
ncbi:hypothetical protein FQR65_LT09585 [Abscondita terminalis]|nr:hypothetical protein FQR65_LT09585 [Abscondita terminalis]